MSSSNSQPDEYLTDAEIRAWGGALLFTTAVLRALDDALVAAHRISIKEFDVLITLFNAPGGRMRMTELAERAILTPSGLSHLVTRLERDGLVRRTSTPRIAAASSRRSRAPATGGYGNHVRRITK